MQRGAVLAVVLIYLVLAWVFGSYGWPLLVMMIIPFGLVGAIWGHVLMGIDLTLLSMLASSRWPASWSTIRLSW